MKIFNKTLKISLFLILFVGMTFTQTVVNGEIFILPTVEGNSPTIDGNITLAEWESSVEFNSVSSEGNITIQVIADGTTLFIALTLNSTNNMIHVNNTIPTNSTESYNNATHDWIVLQFDNNLDQLDIGSETSPDDVIVMDQYNTSVYDSVVKGNVTVPFVSDTLINGTNDGAAVRTNRTINGINQTMYEFSKPLASGDINGSDIDILQVKVLQFKFRYWRNDTANATISTSTTFSPDDSDWFTLRINETGTGVALKEVGEIEIVIATGGALASDYLAFKTLLDQFGFNTRFDLNTSFSIGSEDLKIVILSADSAYSAIDMQSITNHVRSGGKISVFLSNNLNSVSNSLARNLNLNFLGNSLLTSLGGNETTETFSVTPSNTIPFTTGESLVTNETVTSLKFSSGAFNISGINDYNENPYILSQEYYVYDLFNLPTDLVYDSDDDGEISNDESINGLSTGVAIDLLKGGRITVFPSEFSLFNDNVIAEDNIEYLLRMIPWNAKLINTMEVESISLDNVKIIPGEEISISVNLTDGFGAAINNTDVNVTASITLVGNEIQLETLEATGIGYSNTFSISKTGYMVIETTAFYHGFGFAEADDLNLLSEKQVGSFNNLEDLSFFLSIIFILSISIVGFVYFKVK